MSTALSWLDFDPPYNDDSFIFNDYNDPDHTSKALLDRKTHNETVSGIDSCYQKKKKWVVSQEFFHSSVSHILKGGW